MNHQENVSARIGRTIISFILAAFICLGVVPPQPVQTAYAAPTIGYDVGPTAILDGMAIGANDITVYNDQIAFSIAVSSNNYWNMTAGSILDIARIDGGVIGKDLVNDVEFLNDLWTATGTYDGHNLLSEISVDAIDQDADSVTVTISTQYWVADADKNDVADITQFGVLQAPLNIVLTYYLEAGKDYIELTSTVDNPSSNQVTYDTMYAGFSLSTLAANMYGPFGFYPDVKITGIGVGMDPLVQEYFGSYVATYGSDYAVMLYQDYVDSYKGSSGYKDLYDLQDYAPGATADFYGRVVVSADASTAGIMDTYVERDAERFPGATNPSYLTPLEDNLAIISGTVTDGTNPVAGAYVIAQKPGVYLPTAKSGPVNGNLINTAVVSNQPLLWAVTDASGNYTLSLPASTWADPTGDILGNNPSLFTFKVEAAGYTAFQSTTPTAYPIGANTLDFSLSPGAPINLTAVDGDGNPIPFKVSISGLTSEIKTLGGGTYFSDSFDIDPYSISINLSQAEDVTFTASYGGGFESQNVSVTTDIEAAGFTHEFVLPTLIDPEDAGWFAADNHQHSDYGDGSTSAEDLFNAEIAAKLDFALISDHDALAHNLEFATWASSHVPPIPFLSNVEVSPGWGHWGLLGIPANDPYAINPAAITPAEIAAYGHNAGAVVIVHHPYSDYGFLNNQASVNGGTDVGWDDFDLLELQSTLTLSGFEDAMTSGASGIDVANLKGTLPASIANMDQKALASAMAFWNNGQQKYLSAGSDQHDAASSTLYPGIIREYAFLSAPTVDNYLDALVDGEAYVTMGPILEPESSTTMFGSEHQVPYGEQYTLNLGVGSVNGTTDVTLWANGIPVDHKSVGAIVDGELAEVSFVITPFAHGAANNVWYSFTATDAAGKSAVSNPIWFVGLDNTVLAGDLDGQVFSMLPDHVTTKAISVKGFNSTPGSEIVIYDNQGTANQHFRFEYHPGTGTYSIVAVNSGLVLDIRGGAARSGAAVIQWPAHNGLNQQWIVEQTAGGKYSITSAMNPDLLLDVVGHSGANGSSLIVWDRHWQDNQRYHLIPANDSLDGQSFSLYNQAGVSDRALDITGISSKAGAAAILWPPHGQDNQLFTFNYEPLTGYYTITAVHSGLVLDIYGTSSRAGARIIQWPDNGGFNQRWFVEESGTGYVIKSALTGYTLDISGSISADGAAIVCWPENGNRSQVWELH